MTGTFSVLYPQMLGFFYCEESTERNTGLAKKKRKIHTARGVQERKDEFAVVAPTKRGRPGRSMAAFLQATQFWRERYCI